MLESTLWRSIVATIVMLVIFEGLVQGISGAPLDRIAVYCAIVYKQVSIEPLGKDLSAGKREMAWTSIGESTSILNRMVSLTATLKGVLMGYEPTWSAAMKVLWINSSF
jgi:hypothetical protein